MKTLTITEPLIRKLLATVDAGLTAGLGVPTPGKMCVEAAIAFALGEPHSDGPTCVHPVVRAGKIALNDCAWSSDLARAKGLRRVAIAQLGSTEIDYVKYVTLLAQYTHNEIVPLAAESAAKYAESAAISAESAAEYAAISAECAAKSAAKYAESAAISAESAAESAAISAKCAAKSAAESAAISAKYAEYAAESAAKCAAESAAESDRDAVLRLSADLMVRALKECGSPGCEWLWLCDEEAPCDTTTR